MRRTLEIFIQVVIFYSLVTFPLELEFEGAANRRFFIWSERVVAAIFTLEFFARWWFAPDRKRFPFTFAAIADLLAILPFYLGFMVDLRALRLIRTLRLLRVFKLGRYSDAMQRLGNCFWAVRRELAVCAVLVFICVYIGSTLIYQLESAAQPDKFRSLGDSLWWCFVTLTTVGYGDVYPVTPWGRIVAAIVTLAGLGIFGTFVSLIGGAVSRSIQAENNAA